MSLITSVKHTTIDPLTTVGTQSYYHCSLILVFFFFVVSSFLVTNSTCNKEPFSISKRHNAYYFLLVIPYSNA